MLTIVDTWSQFSPAVDPRFTYRAGDVVSTLDRVCAEVGFPKSIGVDQGSEFISRNLDLWTCLHGVILDFFRPGMPFAQGGFKYQRLATESPAYRPKILGTTLMQISKRRTSIG